LSSIPIGLGSMWVALRRSSVLRKGLAWHDGGRCRALATKALPCTTANAVAPVASEKDASSDNSKRSLLLYWKLAKGKLTVWVSLSAIPGYLVALPGAIDPMVLAALAGGTFLTSASAQTINQIAEVDRDGRMRRTMQRPLPLGQLTSAEAACFAATSGSIGLATLSLGATPASAGVAAATMAIYVGLYTPLKVLTPYNTHVGAVSGALPTLLGFTAALGMDLLASPWAPHAFWLFGMQVLWQMPHFYALAWLHKRDYIRGGYNMFPLNDETGHLTAAMSKPYLVALCAMPWGLSACGLASWMLPIGAIAPSALWWRSLRAFEEKPTTGSCRRFFLGSLSYLLSLLALFAAFAKVQRPALPTTDPNRTTGCEATSATTMGRTVEGSTMITEHVVDDLATEALPVTEWETLEPRWREKMRARFLSACPHEKVRHYLFGVGKSGCPMCRESF